MLFGQRLKQIRLEKGYSLRTLAKLSGISSHGYVRNIEEGIQRDVTVRVALMFCKGLDMDLVELIEGVDFD